MDFLDELKRLANDAFGIAAQAIMEQFISAKMPLHLNKSINQAHLVNGTYEQVVRLKNLDWELELHVLEAPDELKVNTVSQYATRNYEKPKPTCHRCNEPGHYKNQCRYLNKLKEQAMDTKTVLEVITAPPQTLTPTPTTTITAITTLKITKNVNYLPAV